MLYNWIKIAIFNYKKNWLSTLINFLGLAVGLTGFILILMHWNDEESYEKWNPKKDQIYSFQSYYKKYNLYGNTISYPMAMKALADIPELEDYVLFNTDLDLKFTAQSKSIFQEGGFAVSEHFFNFFSFQLVSGSYQDVLKEKNAIAISDEMAQKLFGKTNVAGELISTNTEKFVIKAVYHLPKDNSQVKPQFVMLAYEVLSDSKEQWSTFNFGCLFMLKPEANPRVVEEKFKTKVIDFMAKIGAQRSGISSTQYLDLYGPNAALLTPLDEIKLHAKSSWFGKGDFKTLMILFSLSVLVLLLSAINFINLKTAQASQRAKEVGVRKVIGGRRFSLVVQFVLETFFICMASYVISLVLVELLLPSFNKFLGKTMSMNDWHIYAYSLMMVFGVALVSGIIPALYLSNFKAISTLKGNFSRSKHGIWLRNGILGLQLVISSFFIIAGLIIHGQVNYMMSKDLGFNGSQIMNIEFLAERNWLKYERLRTEISKIRGVEAVTYGEAYPGVGNYSSSSIDYKDKSHESQHGAMDYNYLHMMGVTLLKGRWLDSKFASDSINNMIVNEAFVSKFGWTNEQALDKVVEPGFDSLSFKIVGVVKDFNIYDVSAAVQPMVFFHYKATDWKRDYMRNIIIKISKDDIQRTLDSIKAFWASKVEPGYPMEYYFLDKKFAETFDKYKRQQTLFTVLNIIVLLVALLGLFALSSLLIEQKLKEVAIRKVLGASEGDIVVSLTKKFLGITAVSVLLSMPISYYFMNEWLKDFAYRISMPWWPYALSFVLLLLLTFLVVSIKAYRATQVNLVKYLKYE